MDDKEKALKDAAFHAWFALGEWLVQHPGPSAQHEEFLRCYVDLEAALKAFEPPREESD